MESTQLHPTVTKAEARAATPAPPEKKGKHKKVPFPHTVTVGSVSVTIYHTPSHGCDSYTLSYYQDGARKRPTFSTFQAAKEEAEVVARRLGSQDVDVLELKSADRAAYLRALELLKPVGVGVEMAAAQYAHARSLLGDVPLSSAVQYYVKRHPVPLEPKPVGAVVEELLAAKQADKLSERYLQYLQYLRWSLGRFARRFQTTIGMVMGSDIDAWLRATGLSPRTRNNLRNAVQTLFNFAKARRYLPKDHAELEAVAVLKDGDGDIEVFTPAELLEMLNVAEARLLPFLAVGAFAGIRHAEIQRLDWRDIRFEDGLIEIRASKAKTASRRTVPLLANLAAWLRPHRRASGSVCAPRNMSFELHQLVRRVNQTRRKAWAQAHGVTAEELQSHEAQVSQVSQATKVRGKQKAEVPPGAATAKLEGWTPFAWKHNALRHSFISYRVAAIQNVAQVALEAGNSPQMIFKHYRELVRPADAKAWFSIAPAKPGTIIELPPAKPGEVGTESIQPEVELTAATKGEH